ncbi:amidohydrolase [Brevibacterium sp. RIT 803]|uniref:amidohydrolase n=1 Tax=Brevibacterium sp. RIT 803 TaxID=2810210 RepID=UPI0019509B52|nr:amidohydrolase [Brevibacterium sp. RIT 803]MBM6588719.1 amidohydrolase [Brevibacterium sp. RIT 803]
MASTYFHNGTIWRGTGVDTADALLVRDGVVVAVGSADVDRHLAALDTASDSADACDQVDLDGGFLMPSFGDGHAHPIFGGLEAEGPQVRTCSSVDEIVAEVRRFAQTHPEIEWITGASYDGSLVDGGLFDARWLDEAVADRPVVLRAWDYHTVWCNSRALELAGITAETPEPELGEIPRRGDGSPLGTLREWGAVDLVDAVRPPLEETVQLRALERAADYYLERGVTWVQDAWVEPADVETYIAASTRGRLTLRFNLALYADPRRFSAQLPAMVEARRRIQELGDPLLSAHTVKFFADGVVENETGSLLEPYCSSLHNHGLRVWEGETLAEAVRAVDAAGFQVHIHAIGDAAVRQALDAIESAIAANGPRDRRPVIAHAQLVDSADLARFAEIGVIANMQPLWAQLDDLMTVLTVPRLGESRASNQYRMRSILELGGRLSFGSDWPCTSGTPVEGLAIGTSRQNDAGEPAGGWTPEEIVDIDRALDTYSTAVAYQAFADTWPASWGEIRPGASADLIRFDHDPRHLSPQELAVTAVRTTYLGGVAVHSSI